MTTADVGFEPGGISFEEAYGAIRQWCRAHVGEYETAAGMSAKSKALIAALPDVADASDVEMRAVFGEVIAGNLLWAYKKSDGRQDGGVCPCSAGKRRDHL